MLDWDNIRIFLSVTRNGSIRAAAQSLGVNHATVSRRITNLEQQLGVRLFEKLPSGYQITPAGEEILLIAEGMEAEAISLQRKVFGRDTALTGSLRVTLPQIVATNLFMPVLAQFTTQYPGISLEIETSYETLSLTKRQADVAIRLAYGSPPEHLYGQNVATVHRAAYVSKDLLANQFSKVSASELSWITKEGDGAIPSWALGPNKKPDVSRVIVNDPISQLEAIRSGFGAGLHFCFVGDRDPFLRRLPPAESHPYGDLWVLTHGDLRRTPRVQAFMAFASEAIRANRDLLEGKYTQKNNTTDAG
jgi:DNA-binding transcriptional LysR family regulator